jgi:hypothetical protein
MPKVKGEPVLRVEGLEIYVNHFPAKREGRDRVWVQVRQKQPKSWPMAATLAYPHGIDVRFERPQDRSRQIQPK